MCKQKRKIYPQGTPGERHDTLETINSKRSLFLSVLCGYYTVN